MDNATGGNNSNYFSFTGGYTCGRYGSWVTNGSYHACMFPTVQPQPQYIYIYPQSSPQYEEILAELRSIRRLLESK